MRTGLVALLIFMTYAADVSSKDKPVKVSLQQMVSEMKDAFSCGVVVEKYLHGTLKGNDDAYHKLRQENHCDHVESVLNSTPQ
jgi:hypothetical protein